MHSARDRGRREDASRAYRAGRQSEPEQRGEPIEASPSVRFAWHSPPSRECEGTRPASPGLCYLGSCLRSQLAKSQAVSERVSQRDALAGWLTGWPARAWLSRSLLCYGNGEMERAKREQYNERAAGGTQCERAYAKARLSNERVSERANVRVQQVKTCCVPDLEKQFTPPPKHITPQRPPFRPEPFWHRINSGEKLFPSSSNGK